jgi:hypothetical protein
LAAIVTLRSHSHDDMGYTLHLHPEQTLMAEELIDPDDFDVFCAWNQPYMSFDSDVLSAPYSFTLYFGAQGVAHAREVQALLSQAANADGSKSFEPTIFRSCFGSNAPEFLERLRASVLEGRADPS